MTIGPEPMTRMRWMSVRRGILCRVRTGTGARSCLDHHRDQLPNRRRGAQRSTRAPRRIGDEQVDLRGAEQRLVLDDVLPVVEPRDGERDLAEVANASASTPVPIT